MLTMNANLDYLLWKEDFYRVSCVKLYTLYKGIQIPQIYISYNPLVTDNGLLKNPTELPKQLIRTWNYFEAKTSLSCNVEPQDEVHFVFASFFYYCQPTSLWTGRFT